MASGYWKLIVDDERGSNFFQEAIFMALSLSERQHAGTLEKHLYAFRYVYATIARACEKQRKKEESMLEKAVAKKLEGRIVGGEGGEGKEEEEEEKEEEEEEEEEEEG
uniref:Uncharacterized protein n=1 Tax=Vespula pensylvanica TaxID=30213 RepID=A0A834P8Q1_VESPE|nr:hypothetical protein H0235_005215 [Vespula pensylvanica]